MTLEERAADRKRRIVATKASDFAQAEDWDLIFWQSRTPEERLAALVVLRNDLALLKKAKRSVSGRKSLSRWTLSAISRTSSAFSRPTV